MSRAVLTFQDVTFHYPSGNLIHKHPILEDIHFQVNAGEFVSIIGASGSGKSTIFRLITGLEQPIEGKIYLNGKSMSNQLGQVGYMPQQDLLMPWRTVMDNAILPLEIKGVKKAEAIDEVRKLLGEFGLEGVEDAFPSDLSGGMKQRVSFLRSVLSGSNILLLDEPFSALDAITRLNMQEWLLGQWEKRRKTILFITHDVEEALFLSDRIFILEQEPNPSLKEVHVPLRRPRNVRDLTRTEVVIMRGHLIDQLRLKVKK
ncbi:ABC transporter ATP-binding protein [Virgibacillus profundi]|uniref:ABC transporter ATP-binding protein n=1 Tax=Virgibacillus profundi TaxID=2024555 RepID=A0A2A2IC97_9BACI|nr:ABC transporter ATP-binding protein [Virgibacillus profundi]PAV29359.1 ABC transporter ATP-binding protein [Virgibacillus profundi]PXY53528.1 ABC transporter ATP-binding protein [Virgibacillus profundi]